MIPKDAIKKIQARIDTDFLNGEPFPTELEMAIEALEKQAISEETSDRYRWHDLRKDPTDLPRKNGMYWVCVEGFDTKYTSTYWDGYVWWGYSVIGWKEIEPFVSDTNVGNNEVET